MSERRSFDRVARALLEPGPTEAPERAVRAVLRAIETTPQERQSPLRLPWRTAQMPLFPRLAAAAVVLIAIAALGLTFVRPSDDVAAPAPPAETAAPSAAAPSAAASPAPAGMTTYTSERYGFTVTYPAVLEVRPSLKGWAGEPLSPATPSLDRFDMQGPDQVLFFGVASQAVPDGTTAEEWLDAYYRRNVESFPQCSGDPDGWQPTTIDGVAGRIAYSRCDDHAAPIAEAMFVADGRGWVITGDRQIVETILPTFRLPATG